MGWLGVIAVVHGRHSRGPWLFVTHAVLRLVVTHAVLGLACSSLWLVLMAQDARSSSSRHVASAVFCINTWGWFYAADVIHGPPVNCVTA